MRLLCFVSSNATFAADYDKLLDSIYTDKAANSIDGTDIDYKKALDTVNLDKMEDSIDLNKVKEALSD